MLIRPISNRPRRRPLAQLRNLGGAARLAVAGALGVMVALGAADASAQGANVSEASVLQKQSAQAKYTEGAKLFADEDFEAARAAFEASFGVVRSPNAHLMISRSIAGQGDAIAAYASFAETIRLAEEASASDGRYAATADKARELREELKGELAFVSFEVKGADDATAIRIGGELIGADAFAQARPVAPGTATVELVYAGAVKDTRSIELAKGTTEVISFDLTAPAPGDGVAPVAPPPESKGGGDDGGSSALVPLAATAGGIGAAGLIVFAIAGVMNQSTHSDLEAVCADGECPPEVAGDISAGRTQQTIANVGLIIGASGLALAGTFIAIELASSDDGSDTARLVVTGHGAALQGTF